MGQICLIKFCCVSP